jgi:hypothetical protein
MKILQKMCTCKKGVILLPGRVLVRASRSVGGGGVYVPGRQKELLPGALSCSMPVPDPRFRRNGRHLLSSMKSNWCLQEKL